MLSIDKIIEIFCLVDDFCKQIETVKEGHVLIENGLKNQRIRKFKMSDSEVITILIIFHLMNFRELKHFLVFRTFLQHPHNSLKINCSILNLGVAKLLVCLSES